MQAAYLNGKFFGRLLCLRRVGADSSGNALWLCLCDCERAGIVTVAASNLKKACGTKSCGCLRVEAGRRAGKSCATHGLSQTPGWRAWRNMLDRCYKESDSHYESYGGRGIPVCERWRESAANFIEDMGQPPPGHELDREENDDGYWCGKCAECLANGWQANCRWATPKQNCRNRRTNRFVTLNGVRMTIAEAAEKTGIKSGTIRARLRYGWSEDEALGIVPRVKPQRGLAYPRAGV